MNAVNAMALAGLALAVLLWSRIHHWTGRAIRAEAAFAKIEATIAECGAMVRR